MDLDRVIKDAKLGRARREAQEDTCAVFAAALHDVLQANDVPCQMVRAENGWPAAWSHSVVAVDDRYYDSMGEFSVEIYRNRAKIHPAVTVDIAFHSDCRGDCYEPEFDELHAFFVRVLGSAVGKAIAAKGGAPT